MPIYRKDHEISGLRVSGGLARDILLATAAYIKPGLTTGEVDQFSRRLMNEAGCTSAFLNYRGFPGNICISMNEEVVHGIGGRRIIQMGDVVKIDIGIHYKGWVGDNAISVVVGMVSTAVERLLLVTEDSLYEAIRHARHGIALGDLCHSVEKFVNRHGYTVVREYVGHGVGRQLHEDPSVPNYGKLGGRPILKEGMVLAIEPMVNMGVEETVRLKDGWTVITKDRLPSAHFEHMVLITKGEPEILTPRPRVMRRSA